MLADVMHCNLLLSKTLACIQVYWNAGGKRRSVKANIKICKQFT